MVRQSEESLEPDDAICIGVQDPHALETDLDPGQTRILNYSRRRKRTQEN